MSPEEKKTRGQSYLMMLMSTSTRLARRISKCFYRTDPLYFTRIRTAPHTMSDPAFADTPFRCKLFEVNAPLLSVF